MADVKNAKLSTSVGQLNKYLNSLAEKDPDPGGVLLAESYAAELNNADKQQARWRRIYYDMRSFVIISSALITVLTAFNLHGTLAFAFRLTTLALSASVTIVTGLLELLQVNNRWRLYRQLRTTLESVGWRTAAQRDDPTDSLAKLSDGLIKAMHNFERHYTSQVAATTDEGGESGAPPTEDSKARRRTKNKRRR